MNQLNNYNYFENKDFQFIDIPYKGRDKSFCIILPTNELGIGEVEAKFDNKMIDSIYNYSQNQEVILTMPKFRLETSYLLNESLNALGLKEAFTTNANFSGINKKYPLMISSVYHKAFIEIDEKKTEAAAATLVCIESSASCGGPIPKPKIFKADHPFIFMIIDKKTKGILFMGRYVVAK